MNLSRIETPCLLLDVEKTQSNIERMQSLCDRHKVELRPHVKTHKMVEVAKRQLEAGAAGLVCSKLSEAEALLPSGVTSIFIAYSIVDPLKARRIQRLKEAVEDLTLAVTSVRQAEALNSVLEYIGGTTPVMMAIDSGLGREGARTLEQAIKLAGAIHRLPRMNLRGIYTHEGHAYKCSPEEKETIARAVHRKLHQTRSAIDPNLALWPGCSVTAGIMATLPGIAAVRPGAYVFGDLSHCHRTKTMQSDQVSLQVLATVVDKPEQDLALIDAGSKTFSSDRAPDSGFHAMASDGRDIAVHRLSEEHGFLTGSDVRALEIGERIAIIPTHVCPVVNLADEAVAVRNGTVVERWKIEGRGKTQ